MENYIYICIHKFKNYYNYEEDFTTIPCRNGIF